MRVVALSKVLRHLVLPDTQVRPGVPTDHLIWAARYALEKRPDVIVHLGDHWDFPSLSCYESSSTKVANGRDILADIESGNAALALFDAEIKAYNRTQNHRRRYRPKRLLLRGNHDGETNGGRVGRAIEADPVLRGFFEAHPLESPGWDVVPFLQPVIVHGIKYCHFFVRNANGQVVQSRRGMPSAKAQVVREACSATSGHKQGFDYHAQPVGHAIHHGLIAGSFYQHDEGYLTPQGNHHWRGIVLKNDVRPDGGHYDLCAVSLDYLRRKYS
jgi:hypothetical protein